MSINHYFSSSESEELGLREISVELAGLTHKVYTSTGIFSPEHIDQGTQVLLNHLASSKPVGTILDIGCGWGPIALAIALTCPDTRVIAIDTNHKSLKLTKLNAEKLGLSNIETFLPQDVPADLLFDEIWSNPPIRVGKAALHEILETWLARLKPNGTAKLVVQKNLGSDSLQKWLVKELPSVETTRIDSQKGFRIIKCTKS